MMRFYFESLKLNCKNDTINSSFACSFRKGALLGLAP